MRILVTGGTGYLGAHVREYFGADDLSRRSGRDILSTYDAQAAADYDVVIHFAAMLDKDPAVEDDVFRTNIEGTINILKNVRKDAVFIFASTKDVYGRFADNFTEVPETCPLFYSGQSALEWSKLIAEHYVDYYSHRSGFRSCILRMSTVYGATPDGTAPNFVGHYADAINKGERIRLPGRGRPRRDLLHVRDLSAACSAFADSVIRHGTYNIGGGRSNSLTLTELVRKMEEVSDLQAIVDTENPLDDPVPFSYITDLSRIEQELGWRPSIGVEQGLGTLFGKSLDG